jgi:hypothetical protein
MQNEKTEIWITCEKPLTLTTDTDTFTDTVHCHCSPILLNGWSEGEEGDE